MKSRGWPNQGRPFFRGRVRIGYCLTVAAAKSILVFSLSFAPPVAPPVLFQGQTGRLPAFPGTAPADFHCFLSRALFRAGQPKPPLTPAGHQCKMLSQATIKEKTFYRNNLL